MNPGLADEEWQLLTGFLPEDWRHTARSCGALTRARNVSDPDTLLRLIFLHTATGLSLRQTVARARVVELAAISDVALLKRLRRSEGWLCHLNQQLASGQLKAAARWAQLAGRILRVVDATDVEEPGATGTDWRVHYTLRLPSLECDFFELTDVQGGETLLRLPVQPGDLLLADRGYANRAGAVHVIRNRGDVIVRLNGTSFPLLDGKGKALDLVKTLCQLQGHQPGEWKVQFDWEGTRYSGRLCAVRKTRAATERTRQKLRRRAQRKQEQLQPETLALAEFFFVFTTLPADGFPVATTLELYGCRWQVELVFKRLKSLLGLGHLPKYDERSCRAWLQAKLLCALLIERLMREAKFFSPWGFALLPEQRLATVSGSA
jgi:hypothetical protein